MNLFPLLFADRHHRQAGLPDQRPVGEQLRLFNISQGNGFGQWFWSLYFYNHNALIFPVRIRVSLFNDRACANYSSFFPGMVNKYLFVFFHRTHVFKGGRCCNLGWNNGSLVVLNGPILENCWSALLLNTPSQETWLAASSLRGLLPSRGRLFQLPLILLDLAFDK